MLIIVSPLNNEVTYATIISLCRKISITSLEFAQNYFVKNIKNNLYILY